MFPVSIEPFSCSFPFYTKAGVIGVRSILKREHTPFTNTIHSFHAIPQDNMYHTESPYEERYSQALSVRGTPWVWADNVLATTNILGIATRWRWGTTPVIIVSPHEGGQFSVKNRF
nr:MAG: hypothetical protein H1RhizoLitter12217_000005 [Mitovirus sp.]